MGGGEPARWVLVGRAAVALAQAAPAAVSAAAWRVGGGVGPVVGNGGEGGGGA